MRVLSNFCEGRRIKGKAMQSLSAQESNFGSTSKRARWPRCLTPWILTMSCGLLSILRKAGPYSGWTQDSFYRNDIKVAVRALM